VCSLCLKVVSGIRDVERGLADLTDGINGPCTDRVGPVDGAVARRSPGPAVVPV
jgi:hypothetical protein